MRALWVATLALGLLIGAWGLFFSYTARTLPEMEAACADTVFAAIEAAAWEEADAALAAQQQRWQTYRSAALFFLDTRLLSEIDQTFVKTRMYIRARDGSNSTGELLTLREQLRQLREGEALTWENIF